MLSLKEKNLIRDQRAHYSLSKCGTVLFGIAGDGARVLRAFESGFPGIPSGIAGLDGSKIYRRWASTGVYPSSLRSLSLDGAAHVSS